MKNDYFTLCRKCTCKIHHHDRVKVHLFSKTHYLKEKQKCYIFNLHCCHHGSLFKFLFMFFIQRNIFSPQRPQFKPQYHNKSVKT